MSELKDMVIAVTGGASGLGKAICVRATELGAKVAVMDLNGAAAAEVAAGLAGARSYAVDVSDAAQVNAVYAQIAADFGRIDGAVNNAGIGGEFGPITACSNANWDKVIAVNLTSVFLCMKAQLPIMLEGGGGSIVNMASLAGLLAEPALPAYITAKHGVVGLTKSAAIDYGKQNIRCNAVCPSFIKTPMVESAFPDPAFWEKMGEMHMIGRMVTAEEVADIATFLLSKRSGGMTGSVHLADGGAAAH
jgi:NAD(P)-dependent dehydrogenase (short-subunit alcohol dehydrogenase family)